MKIRTKDNVLRNRKNFKPARQKRELFKTTTLQDLKDEGNKKRRKEDEVEIRGDYKRLRGFSKWYIL